MNVLLVEQDAVLAAVLSHALRREGHRVEVVGDGRAALERWEATHADILVLEVILPRLTGFEVCRRIRQASPTAAVILMGARGDEAAILQGLQLGADDYLIKPFNPAQLLARMEAVHRRYDEAAQAPAPAGEIRMGNMVLDPLAYTATQAGVTVSLTPLEFRVLAVLIQNAGQVVTYGSLVSAVWGYAEAGTAESSGILKTHVSHLRKKLQLPPRGPGGLSAVSGVGYRLDRG